jgi:hybrid cluster-associated redox disulfide protein
MADPTHEWRTNMTVDKNMIISDVLQMDKGTVPIFFRNGLHCLGCAMASGETIEEACAVHGLDCDSLISQLNSYFEVKDLPAANV